MAQDVPDASQESWSLAEVVDLPLALEEERVAPGRDAGLEAARRDLEGSLGDLSKRPPAQVLHAWLQRWQRKNSEDTPGIRVAESLKLGGWLALAAGLVLGLVSASSRLVFTGPEPLNVFFLLGVFVFLPLAVSLVMLSLLRFRQAVPLGFFQRCFVGLARRWHGPRRNLPAGDPLQADATWSLLSHSLGRNQRLLQLPMLAVSQKFALGFGIGLFVMLQIRVSFWELAFGWQTTLAAPGEWWHAVVRGIAIPWSGFWPDGVPTLEQINATRFSRLDGAPPLSAEASRAWWPFLAAAILVWSVLLRGLVLAAFTAVQRRRMSAFDPELPDAHLLLRRLAPAWSTARQVQAEDSAALVGGKAFQGSAGPEWMAFVPDELDPSTPKVAEIEGALRVTVVSQVPFQFDDSLSESTTAALAELKRNSAPVAVLLPSARDPIDEVCDTLKLIEEASRGRVCAIVLSGDRSRLGLWKNKLAVWRIGLPAEFLPTP